MLIENATECEAAMAELEALLEARPGLESAQGRRALTLARGVKDWLLDDTRHADMKPDPAAKARTLALWADVEGMLAALVARRKASN